jgi:hypothetical protein
MKNRMQSLCSFVFALLTVETALFWPPAFRRDVCGSGSQSHHI